MKQVASSRTTPVMSPTLNHLFFHNVEQFRHAPLLSGRCNGRTVEFTTSQFRDAVLRLSDWLLSTGLQPGDRVAVLSENRPEWHIVDFAILLSGMVSVPLYTTFSAEQIGFVLEHSGASALVVSTPELFRKVASHTSSVRAVITIDAPAEPANCTPLQAILGAAEQRRDESLIRQRALAIDPNALVSIVYTSGTTGTPKGVMLTHRNIVSNLTECITRLACNSAPRALSVLPLAHVFERLLCYGYFQMGIPIAYGHPHDLAELFPLHRPAVMGCVPRILEKIRENVLAEIARQPKRRQAIAAALLKIGHDHIGGGMLRRRPTFAARMLYPLADALLYRKVKRKLGGELQFLICGGAPLRPAVEEFFLAAGFRVLQGYGLTETSPVISLTPFEAIKCGTVGKPLDNLELRFADDGELLVRGPSVTSGYYSEAALTEAAFRDGWFCTGDLGRLDEDGYLVITGRKKEMIVTSGGKNILPVPIEEQLSASPLIARAVVVGEGRKFVGALIVPHRDALSALCRRLGAEWRTLEDLAGHEAVHREFMAEIQRLQKGCSSAEMIRNFAFIDEELLTDPDVMTPTQKIRRAALERKYCAVINRIYELAEPAAAMRTVARAQSVTSS